MKILINIVKQIKDILVSLENILWKEYHNLLNSNTNIGMLELIRQKQKLFKNFFLLSKNRLLLEKKHGIFAPYKNNYQLNNYWNEIVKKCFLLRKLNLKNKILINKKFHLNQYFLELFSSHKKYITYNINGNLEM